MWNTLITLSDGTIATAERGALSIWKPKLEEGEKKFELFKEILTHSDTYQLIEVNPKIFAYAMYGPKLINVYKNDSNEYPLLGNITNVSSHGNNSNGMAKINDNLFGSCSNGGFLYIVSVQPVQIVQKIIFEMGHYFIHFLHKSNDKFIFTSVGDMIIQYKIITDEDDNFIKLEEFDVIKDGIENEAIITTDEGKIFYEQKIENENLNGKTNFFSYEYKKLWNKSFISFILIANILFQ